MPQSSQADNARRAPSDLAGTVASLTRLLIRGIISQTLLLLCLVGSGAAQIWSEAFYTPFDGGYSAVGDIDWGGVTHIAFIGGTPQSTGTVLLTSGFSTVAPALIAAAHANNAKVLFVLGPEDGSYDFADAITNNLSTLVENTMSTVNTYGFDGVDIDFEGGWNASLGANLFSALRTALGSKLLVSDAQINLAGDYTATLSGYLDRVSIMVYDLANSADPYSWFNGALAGPDDPNGPPGWTLIDATYSINRFIASGTPAGKINLGIPFFGMLASGSQTGPHQAYPPLPSFAEVTYATIVTDYSIQNATYDSQAHEAWVPVSGVGWINWDTPQSVADKAAYVISNHLGGWMMFSLEKDYLPTQTPKHPLLNAAKLALGGGGNSTPPPAAPKLSGVVQQ